MRSPSPDSLDRKGVRDTIASGRLWCDFDDLYEAMAFLMDRPVFTHEMADHQLWVDLRAALAEHDARAAQNRKDGAA